jgi:NIPSNAP
MTVQRMLVLALVVIALPFLATVFAADAPQARGRVFEMRTYYTHPGRLAALNARFSDHTVGLFKKHGMDVVGFWTPQDGQPGHDDTLVYLLAYPDREARETSWKAFQADPAWKEAKAESEKDGPIVKEVKSVFLDPTDYSAIK